MPRKRLTRSAYKRKAILFGLLVFLAIGLVTTGFASWMMSSSAKTSQSGNVNVGIIQSANLEFDSIELYKLQEFYNPVTNEFTVEEVKVTSLETGLDGFIFSFEPHLNDNTGRVHYGESEYGSESMTMIIRGVVGPVSVLRDVTIELKLPEFIEKAVSAGYIDVPECSSKPKVLTLGHGLEVSNVDTRKVQFEYTITFKWGSAFNYMNPGLYFDSDPSGMNATTEEIMKDLYFLRAYVYGYGDVLQSIYDKYNEGLIDEIELQNQLNLVQEDTNKVSPTYDLIIIANIR